jgi:hypothetical protein
MGRRVAKDVFGEVSVDRSFLEPINFPLFDGEVLEVGVVPPFPTEDNFTFRIALLKKKSGETPMVKTPMVKTPMVKTPIVVTFLTPEGDYLQERLEFAL